LEKYFENNIFLEELKESSEKQKNELNIFEQLKNLSKELCYESTNNHLNIFD
jgi:hypothetical protein